MSEEILEALAVLFGIISKQDGGVTEGLRGFVVDFFRGELDSQNVDKYMALYDERAEYSTKQEEAPAEEEEPEGEEGADGVRKKKRKKATRVNDSVKVLGLCKRQFNKTLNQQQKTIVLVKLLELVAAEQAFTENRMEIIGVVSEVFNIDRDEYRRLEAFVKARVKEELNHEDFLVFDEAPPTEGSSLKYIDSGYLDGEILFVRVNSVNLYFTKYTGGDEIFLNSRPVTRHAVLQFPPGSVFRTPKGAPLYYSDLVSTYNSDKKVDNLTFNANDLEFRFPNNAIGLRNVNISEGPGNLIGIMGASGAGKTTLLNVLAGLETPSAGEVLINGHNIHRDPDKIEGVIGYIAQDDLLIEELTVYQNLYYNAKLCFKDLTEEQLHARVIQVLENLGLDRIRDLKVGNVLNKKISGGQRKRLNIALELIREPAVMFVDEPTSGLSSRDSENVIDLLKELSLKGKLIFVVIHQPSSDIFKMFDKMLIMDTGGYPIFYGNPIEAVIYFKTAAHQVASDRGQCMTCGNVNPEQIFNIVEARVVDEYGEFTNKRKVLPEEWHQLYNENIKLEKRPDAEEDPPGNLKLPSWFMQGTIFTIRDFLSKISNKQYLLINLLEAPLLALLLSLIIRYKSVSNGEYIYRHNENIPAFILICVIVALFMGLTVSAEEIIRDRKIKKRESFLNLSRSSYLVSKLIILFCLSAVQTLTFVLIGNTILEIQGMHVVYWLALFTVSCHANVLGLNISSAFNSAVTVYIIIPLLLIPQMILSGAIFSFDRLNNWISDKGTVPVIADMMASRWAYEGIAVSQYMNNDYTKGMFRHEIERSEAQYKFTYWSPEVLSSIDLTKYYLEHPEDSASKRLPEMLGVIGHAFLTDRYLGPLYAEKGPAYFSAEGYSVAKAEELRGALEEVRKEYNNQLIRAGDAIEEAKYALVDYFKKHEPIEGFRTDDYLEWAMNRFFNEKLESVMQNESAEEKFILQNGQMLQMMDPGFRPPYPSPAEGRPWYDYRTHFYAPVKYFGRQQAIDTFVFNICAIWLMTAFLYVSLYYEWLKKSIDFLGNLGSKGD
jgi:ABC-type multidrug transport system ATPase subunit